MEAGDQGRYSKELLASALSRSDTPLGLTVQDGRTQDLVTSGVLPKLVKDPAAYFIEYRDGLKATLLMLNGAIKDFNFAARVRGMPGNQSRHKTPLIEDAERVMQEAGRKLGVEAVRVARTITTSIPPAPLRTKTVIVTSNNRWDVEKLKAVAQERYRIDASRTARLVRQNMQLPVTTILIGGDIRAENFGSAIVPSPYAGIGGPLPCGDGSVS